ncbi:MAG: M3 family oligoendopeptidase [Bacillaceae bacterium]
MTFQQYEYIRPDMEVIKVQMNEAISHLQKGTSLDEQVVAIEQINKIRNQYETMATLCSIHYSIDTTDSFYTEENDFFDEHAPIMQSYISKYYKALVSSSLREELEGKYGNHLFSLAEMELKTFDESIIEDLQGENKLTTKYQNLIASAKREFKGEELTLPQLAAHTESLNREERKEAAEAYYSFFAENVEELDDIYDQLVKVRTKIAKKLGFESFVELAYARMLRTDYDAEMVANFRQQVLEHIVPVVSQLREQQREALHVDTLHYYDEKVLFLDGNAKPKGSPDWILENGKAMYEGLSEETGQFITYMLDNNLMDVLSRPGKSAGGYCTYIPAHRAPFIFANFNGTSGDIDVLTHEAGHAFQVYCSRDMTVPEYTWPTYEACEIHSMSMEFFTYPYMEKFFGENVEKYYQAHFQEAITFFPYGVAVDEFQHEVYANPSLTPAERRALWRTIEKKYIPTRDYENNDYLEGGGFWQRQGHIYESPFYYIDYTLAQICALQFWKRMRENYEEAWDDYVALCKLGGSQSFLGLVQAAKLNSPFEDGTVENVMEEVQKVL